MLVISCNFKWVRVFLSLATIILFMGAQNVNYTCQLFLRCRREIFILGFLKTTRSFPKIPEEVRSLPKTKLSRKRLSTKSEIGRKARPWFRFSTRTSSVAGLALCLVAFARATLVVLRCGENGTAILNWWGLCGEPKPRSCLITNCGNNKTV